MESPTGIVPEYLIEAGMRRPFIDWLLAQPWDGEFKLQVLAGWANVCGVLTSASEQSIVRASGWRR